MPTTMFILAWLVRRREEPKRDSELMKASTTSIVW
jgi:hypothetical protein